MVAGLIGFEPVHDDVMIMATEALEQYEAMLFSDGLGRRSGDGLSVLNQTCPIRKSHSRVSRPNPRDIGKVRIDDNAPLDSLRCNDL
ncbi:hypothetical protein [Pseudomonas sp. EA_65y_Pfl1_P113]|uniref:hypothetical protein n=1 Tax=Pseudomonas sp. EA_65y_Pfl1_P113 TaxID=3088692 RepID=UPI0030DBDB9D